MKAALALLLSGVGLAQTWAPQPSGTTASLRGVSAVNARVVWAGGTKGTFLRTTDGGAAWRAATLPHAEDLDFRGVRAFDERMAFLLSSGPGDKSRIYRTNDAGATWQLQFTNPDPTGFFDAVAFWDRDHGMVLGDPVNGHFVVLTTGDGGRNWTRQETPPALEKEAAFAASNTCLFVLGKSEAWFGTGGPGGARVFHSTDRGRTWTAAATPVRNDGPSAGIFSLAFRDRKHGIAVGGDYAKPDDSLRNSATTPDGGRTWSSAGAPAGFRSAVAFLRDAAIWIAVGTSGSDSSADGKTWRRFDAGAYNAVSFVSSEAGWAVGPNGRVAKFRLK